MSTLIRLMLSLMLLVYSTWAMAVDSERTAKQVQFPKDKSHSNISGSIKGHHYIDYRLPASAGQTMRVSLKGSNKANYFNVLPPESSDAAMAIGEFSNNRFEGMLPDDGVYTIRVFLMRSAARRNETSTFKLTVGLAGTPLKPVAATIDAVLPGTRYHASTTVSCEPAYSKARKCEAMVIRRGFDGTATVEVRWPQTENPPGKRRILFVKGEPKGADTPQAMSYSRDEHGWRVNFNGDEHFEIPESLVLGG